MQGGHASRSRVGMQHAGLPYVKREPCSIGVHMPTHPLFNQLKGKGRRIAGGGGMVDLVSLQVSDQITDSCLQSTKELKQAAAGCACAIALTNLHRAEHVRDAPVVCPL